MCLKRLFLDLSCAFGIPKALRILHTVPKTDKIVYKLLKKLISEPKYLRQKYTFIIKIFILFDNSKENISDTTVKLVRVMDGKAPESIY